MGRDLIREFVMMQNNRNRCISESDASTFVEIKDIIDKKKAGKNASSTAMQFVDNLVRKADDADDDGVDHSVVDMDDFGGMPNALDATDNSLENMTYTSLSEIDGNLSAAPRRLYEREVSNESLNMSIQEANNLASFEAKFDKSVEAIWNNCEDEIVPPPTKPNNVEAFWFNYNKHLYNTDHQQQHHDSHSFLSLQPSDENDLGGHQQHHQQQHQHQNHHHSVDFESTNKLLPHLLNSRNDLLFCDVSIAVNSNRSTIKPDSIWSSKARSEDDGSFYANAMLNSVAAAENLMQSSQVKCEIKPPALCTQLTL